MLRRRQRDSLGTTLALNITGLVLFAVVMAYPFMGLQLLGQTRHAALEDLPVAFEMQGMWQLALVVLSTTIIAPLLKLLLTTGVLIGLRTGMAPSTLATMARVRHHLTPWAMVEVFLIGVLVAYSRLASTATVLVGPALYALGGLMLVMVAADAWLDEHALWEAIGRARRTPAPMGSGPLIGCDICGRVSRAPPGAPCRRCNSELEIRKPNSLVRSWAFLLSAAVLYVPANLFPILTLIRFGSGHPSTILGGVRELIEYRMWPLALLVFAASIMVPVLKLVGLATLLLSTQRRAGWRLRDRTRLYRIVDAIGRWSMIDVFMLSVLVGLVRMQLLASVTPGVGAICFAGVVILTMLAS
ncbi:MAG TPA: paraquat-inducible protein A, partial [Acetobacteraceae bacterium]